MREDIPDVRTLGVLRAIGETGSFRQAAVAVGLSQQATSARIAAAERLLGMTLVVRTRRGSTLTENGRLIVEWSADLLDRAERLALSIHALRTDVSSRLTVAASQTIAESLIPTWMAELRRRSGGTQTVLLTSGNSDFVIEEVRAGRADVGLIETPEIPDDVSSARIRDDELIVVVAADHPWARRPEITAAELAATPLITRERGSGTRRTLELALLAAHPASALAEPVAVLSNTGAIRAAAVAGMGPAVLSSSTVRDELDRGMLVAIPIADLVLTRPLTALWKTGVSLPATAETFFDILRS